MFANVIRPIVRLIRGPRPLRPKYLKAFWELCSNPLAGYWNMLNDKDILIRPLEAAQPVPVDPVTMIILMELHAHGVYVTEIYPDERKIRFRIGNDYLTARYSGSNADLFVLTETYVDTLYDGEYSGMSVIDIGGYIGETAIFFAQKGAKCVFCVEPAPDNLFLLKQNVSQSSFRDRIVIIEAAVSSSNGKIRFYVDQSHYAAFHIAEYHEFMQSYLTDAAVIDVEVLGFDKLLDYTGLKQVDLVKLDCEGAEYDILLNTPESVLRRVRHYIIEYHNGPDLLVNRLRSIGYKVRDNFRGGQIGILYAERM